MGVDIEKFFADRPPVKLENSLSDGCEVGKWRIAAFIARGGAGEVYRVVDMATGAEGALKILYSLTEEQRKRFELECSVLRDSSTASFPRLFDSGVYGGRPYYVTELLEPIEPLPSSDRGVADFVTAVADGVEVLHALGYVHRDIKPNNIMMRGDEPVLIDLGLLKPLAGASPHFGESISVVEGKRVGVGTPGYSAPELFTGGDVSPQADVHSLGVLANLCFDGHAPRAWRSIIRRATSSIPAERYRSAKAFANAVRRRHLPFVVGVAAGLLLIAAMVVLFAFPGLRPVSQKMNPEIPADMMPVKPLADAAMRLSHKLGAAIGDDTRVWLTGGTAAEEWVTCVWRVYEEDVDGRRHSYVSSNGDGGTGAVSWLCTVVKGPCLVSFSYRMVMIDGQAVATIGGEPLIQFSGTVPPPPVWKRVSRQVPEGEHVLRFEYRHSGRGYAYMINGLQVADFSVTPIGGEEK